MAIRMNECIISGTIIEDPQVVGSGENTWAFMKLMTSYGQKNADGSYSDADQIVPIIADVPHHVNTAQKYLKKGKAIAVSGYYRSWTAGGQQQHGFFVRKFIFATANYGAEQGGNKTPAMPN